MAAPFVDNAAMGEAMTLSQQAMIRLADEVDGAQARGELPTKGQHKSHVQGSDMRAAGLSRQEVSRARKASALERENGP